MIDAADHVSGKTAVAVTVNLSKAGAGTGVAGGAVAEIGSGLYKVTLDTTDTNTLGDLAFICTGAACDPTWIFDQIGPVQANLIQIDGLATTGNNATLNLKQLNISNSAGDAIIAQSTGGGGRGAAFVGNTNGNGISVQGAGSGAGLNAIGGATGPGFACTGGSSSGPGLLCQGGGDGTGLYGLGTALNPGISGQGGSTTGAGIRGVGGSTGIGIDGQGGSGSGAGMRALASAGNGDGFTVTANGSGVALNAANVTAIKAKTDNLPETIKKNTAYAKFPFTMVSSSDHITPTTGATVTCQRAIDGAAFANCNQILATETGNGWYTVDLAASDVNGTFIALKFTATNADARNIAVKTSL